MGGGSGVAGERGGRSEPVDRTDPGEDFACVQRRDPAQLSQRAAGLGHRCLDIACRLVDPTIQLPDLGDEVRGESGGFCRRRRGDGLV